MSASQVLQFLYSLDSASPDFLRYLYCLLQRDEEEQYLSSLRGPELTRLVDFLDDVLGVGPIADDVFRRCLHKLQNICSHHAILPSSHIVSGDLARVGNDPVALGGFSDVWKGAQDSRDVCIKHLRVSEQIRETVERAFYKEAIIWKRMKHPNIVAFIGVTQNPLQFVSEWMPNGTLTEYINKNPGANRVGLLLDVAEGLDYLHANHTTHGDLKGPNILVDQSGHAHLTDFGFASVVRGLTSVLVTEVRGYTARWAAPEVLGSGNGNTQEADVFAFGMVAMEVFTGECPFSEFTATVAVSKIIDGERPDRPQEPGLTDSLWDMACACWHKDPARRPAITKVVGILRECYRSYAAGLHLSSPGPLRPAKRAVHTKTIDHVAMPFGFPMDYQRINEIAEELANGNDGPKGKRYDELLELCIRWDALPASYELEGVVKQGICAQHVSRVTEIWKGAYDGGVVALKVLGLPQVNHKMMGNSSSMGQQPANITARERFCKAALLMKQLEHNNILPFYGVSITISDISLVFPWYNNGNIEQYLEKNPGINRYDLLLGAVEGLRFLHSNGVVHGALQPNHILIDDDGNARLTIAAHDTSDKGASYSNIYNFMRVPMESDVYGMANIVYEVLTGIAPHWESRGRNPPFRTTDVTPVRPPGAIDDLVWELLEKCWSDTPRERPQIAEVYHTLQSHPKAVYTPRRRFAIGELQGTLELHVHSITLPRGWPSGQEFYVKFKYRNGDYTTALADPTNDQDERTWESPEDWVVETDEQDHEQLVSLEVFRRTKDRPRTAGRFFRDRVHAAERFFRNTVGATGPSGDEEVDTTMSFFDEVVTTILDHPWLAHKRRQQANLSGPPRRKVF